MDKWLKKRALRKARSLIADTRLDLRDVRLYTEAATKAYSTTAGVALLAGASSVHCVARSTRFGTAQQAMDETQEFAEFAGADIDRVTFSEGHASRALAEADLVTNSAPLRPLNADVIKHLRPDAVISLMYEPWEWRHGDIDLAAAKGAGIHIAGVNENHPAVSCHASIGMLALKGLFAVGMEVFTSDVLAVCANRFASSLLAGLAPHCRSLHLLDRGQAGECLPANIKRLDDTETNPQHYDALVLCDLPQIDRWNIAHEGAAIWPRPVFGEWDACVQIMGDIRRADFPSTRFYPDREPPRAYMGMNPGDLGVDLVLRNIVAGLCAGAEMLRALARPEKATRFESHPVNWVSWVLPFDQELERAL